MFEENIRRPPVSLRNLEFVVPENLLKVVSLIDRGTGLNFNSSKQPDDKQRGISVDKDINGNVKFSVKSGNFQVLENGLKCVIRDITNIGDTGGAMLRPSGTANIGGGDNVPNSSENCQSQLCQNISLDDNTFETNNENSVPLNRQSLNLAFDNNEDDNSSLNSKLTGEVQEKEQLSPSAFLSNVKYESVGKWTGTGSRCIKKRKALKTYTRSRRKSFRQSDLNNSDGSKIKTEIISQNEENILSGHGEENVQRMHSLEQALEETSKNILKLSGSGHPEMPDTRDSGDGESTTSQGLGTKRFSVRQIARAERKKQQNLSEENSATPLSLGDVSVCHVLVEKGDDCSIITEDESSVVTDTSKTRKIKTLRTNYQRKRNIQCKLCDGWVKNYVVLYEHIQRLHHNHDDRDSYKEEVKQLKKVTCDVCNKVLSQESELKKHKETIHRPKPSNDFSCHECGKIYRNKKYLRAHSVRAHPKTRVLCHLCPSSFKTKVYLQEHITNCHEKKVSFKCSVCEKTFIARSSWVRHKRKHENKTYPCPHCGRDFFERANLMRHVHTIHELGRAVKKVSCKQCKKAFTNPGNLRQHVKSVHFREFAYNCDICGKGFLRKKALDDHIDSHHRISDIKPNIIDLSNTETLLQNAFNVTMPTRNQDDNVSIVKYEFLDPGSSDVGKNSDEISRSVYVLITQEEPTDNVPVISEFEQQTDLSNIQFIQTIDHTSMNLPPSSSDVTISRSGTDEMSAASHELQQILDIAQLQTISNNEIQIQDVAEEMVSLLEGVEVHTPNTGTINSA